MFYEHQIKLKIPSLILIVTSLLFINFTVFKVNTVSAHKTNNFEKQPAIYDQMPSLKGENAINYLKDTHQFDSLAKAVAGATYTQQAKLVASGVQNNNRFGKHVSISGDTAAVFSFTNDGVYVFVRNGSSWTQQAKLIPSVGWYGPSVYQSLSISGDTVVVGASGGNNLKGAVYVFTRTGTTWTERPALTASDGEVFDHFGYSVSIDGNTVVVGAYNDVIGSNYAGSAYVFVRTGTNWTQQAKLLASDSVSNSYTGNSISLNGNIIVGAFGTSVSVNGNTIIVGASGSQVGSNYVQGIGYVFTRSGTTWAEQAKLLANDGGAGDVFGYSVAVFGNTAVVGALNANNIEGAAYVFVRSGDNWTQQQKFIGSSGGPFSEGHFGSSVAISRDAIVVGASAVNRPGSAYVYTRSNGIWTEQQKFQANNPPETINNKFGDSVAISGNTIIVGSPQDVTAAQDIFIGAAYIYTAPAIIHPTSYDFEGDGKADISVFRPSGGIWYLLNSASGFIGLQFGIETDKIVPADYDGDGKTDIAVYRDGVWYLLRSGLGFSAVAFGAPGDITVPADYDADGKADVAVFRPSNGVWYLLQSTNGFTGFQFGQIGDKPVAADYDGDGKADFAVYRNGNWYLQRSQLGFIAVSFGIAADKPVSADYDGDGKVDIAVFRVENGTWYLQRSQDGFAGFAFGLGTDLPVPADYDGDGKTDIAVFRDGTWYLLQSTSGFAGVGFGLTTDQPVPGAFVP